MSETIRCPNCNSIDYDVVNSQYTKEGYEKFCCCEECRYQFYVIYKKDKVVKNRVLAIVC